MTDAADNDGVLLAARGVGRRYGGAVALAPTTISIRSAETVALVGPNGAGKSTLLSLLAGALAPSEGVVETVPPARVGWVPQQPAQYGRLSARENLELFARLERVEDARSAVERALALVDIRPVDRLAAELSTGNQQRLNVAIALLGDPDVLLLDEPTAALDPGQRRRLWELASGVRERGGAVVFATQNLEEVERLADVVAVLQEGRLVFHGRADAYARTAEADVFA
ncbi:MAG: ABC transporter ATP-binding protein [Thermoleophilia bacterium]|nr:ABC transporter ATP-binding protein [Thermoleophilia bacterium]